MGPCISGLQWARLSVALGLCTPKHIVSAEQRLSFAGDRNISRIRWQWVIEAVRNKLEYSNALSAGVRGLGVRI